jgi:hypothetical protein
MIHFTVTNNDGDRTLYIEDENECTTDILVGEIVKGRTVSDTHGNTRTEWAFIAASTGEQFPTTNRIGDAYQDARRHARTLPGAEAYDY